MRPCFLVLFLLSSIPCSAQNPEPKVDQAKSLPSQNVAVPYAQVGTEQSKNREVTEHGSAELTGSKVALISGVSGAISGLIIAGVNLLIARLAHAKDREIAQIGKERDLDVARLNKEKEKELAVITAQKEIDIFEQSQLQSRENLRRDTAKELALEVWRLEITKEPKGFQKPLGNDVVLGNCYNSILQTIIAVERQNSKD